MAQHHPDNAAAPGTERHSNAEFGRPLIDDERHHAVDADRRNHDAEHAKQAQQQHVELPLRDERVEHLVERPRLGDDDIGEGLVNDAAQARHDGQRIASRAQDEVHALAGHAPGHRYERLRPRVFLGAFETDVGDDPDHPAPAADVDLLTERVRAFEIQPFGRLIQQDRRAGITHVRVVEDAPLDQRLANHVHVWRRDRTEVHGVVAAELERDPEWAGALYEAPVETAVTALSADGATLKVQRRVPPEARMKVSSELRRRLAVALGEAAIGTRRWDPSDSPEPAPAAAGDGSGVSPGG